MTTNILLKALALTSSIRFEMSNDGQLQTSSSKMMIPNAKFAQFLDKITKEVDEEKKTGIYTDNFNAFKDVSIFENSSSKFLMIFNYNKDTNKLHYKSFIFEPSTEKPGVMVYRYRYDESVNFDDNWYVIDSLEKDNTIKEENQLNGLNEDKVAEAMAKIISLHIQNNPKAQLLLQQSN